MSAQQNPSSAKNAVQHGIQPVFAARWSPYGFDPARDVARDDLHAVFEAARWTMSSYNAQPWRYVVGVKSRSPETWQMVHDVLLPGNQGWAQHAPVLAIGLTDHVFAFNGEANKAAVHDLGAASASLTYEATARGLVVHQMIGIDPDKAREVFGVEGSLEPFTALAIGYAAADPNAGNFAERDTGPRQRLSLDELILRGSL